MRHCITAPVDDRLPNGGGYRRCGLYDVRPEKFGKETNLVKQVSDIPGAKQTRRADFFNINVSSRFGSGIQFGGGVDTGRIVNDNCFVVDSPQQLLNCHVVTPFKANTQVKIHGSYPLPGDVTISGAFQNTQEGPLQNVVGPGIEANYTATNGEVFPELGRDLGSCRGQAVCTTATTSAIPLIDRQTMFGGRKNQLDLRVSKLMRFGTRLRLQANVDVFNVLNSSDIQVFNNTYSRTNNRWLQPVTDANVGGAIVDGRFVEFGGKLTF